MRPTCAGKRRKRQGFTLLELLVSIAVGTLVTVGAFLVYKDAMRAATLTSQRSTVQDNSRASLNELTQELSMAGFGIPVGGVVVPDAAVYGCTGSGCPNQTFAFPTVGSGETLRHVFVGAVPHWKQGAIINGVQTDAITIAYVDRSADVYRDDCTTCGYDVPGKITSIVFNAGTTTITFDPDIDPPLSDPTYGFAAGGGDLVMLSNPKGTAIGQVSSVTTNTLTLLSGDSMNLNTASGNGSMANLTTCASGTCTIPANQTRFNKVVLTTYYVQTNPLSYLPPRLMRQVNHRFPPTPVGEQIENLQITYDLYDPTGASSQAVQVSSPANLSLIKKVNLSLVAVSDQNGLIGSSLASSKQRVNLTTSVAPRNLSFISEYR